MPASALPKGRSLLTLGSKGRPDHDGAVPGHPLTDPTPDPGMSETAPPSPLPSGGVAAPLGSVPALTATPRPGPLLDSSWLCLPTSGTLPTSPRPIFPPSDCLFVCPADKLSTCLPCSLPPLPWAISFLLCVSLSHAASLPPPLGLASLLPCPSVFPSFQSAFVSSFLSLILPTTFSLCLCLYLSLCVSVSFSLSASSLSVFCLHQSLCLSVISPLCLSLWSRHLPAVSAPPHLPLCRPWAPPRATLPWLV